MNVHKICFKIVLKIIQQRTSVQFMITREIILSLTTCKSTKPRGSSEFGPPLSLWTPPYALTNTNRPSYVERCNGRSCLIIFIAFLDRWRRGASHWKNPGCAAGQPFTGAPRLWSVCSTRFGSVSTEQGSWLTEFAYFSSETSTSCWLKICYG